MRFRFLSLNPETMPLAVRSGKMTGALAVGAALCLQGVVAGPLHAAPTLGGDTEGPKVRILQPGYQDVLKGTAKILIGINTTQYNAEFIEMLVDDRVVMSPTKLDMAASSQFTWDTTKFQDGPHKLTVRVTDTQGFRGWAEVYVYLNNNKVKDYTPPSLEWLNVKPGQVLSGTAKIQLQAVDNFGVKWIIVSVNPESNPGQKPPLRSWLVNRPPYAVNFDTTTVPDGIYALNARAWDPFEQEGNAEQIFFGISNNPISYTLDRERLDLYAANASGALKTPKNVSGSAALPKTGDSGIPSEAPTPPARVYTDTPPSRTPENGGTRNTVPTTQTPPAVSKGGNSVPTKVARGDGGSNAAAGGSNQSLVPSLPPLESRPVSNYGGAGTTQPKNSTGTPPVNVTPRNVVKPPTLVATTPTPKQPDEPGTFSSATTSEQSVVAGGPATANVERGPLVADLRFGEPKRPSRTVETWDQADMTPRSGSHDVTEATRLAAVNRGDLPTTFTAPDRFGRPDEGERTILDAAAMSAVHSEDATVAYGPTRARRMDETAGNYAPSATSAPQGEKRTLPRLAANLVNSAASSGVPVLSTLAQGMQMSGATRLAPSKATIERPQAGKVTTPKVSAAPADAPQLSSGPRLAMGQEMPKRNRDEQRAAIQVAPLDVDSGQTLPAFHMVERTTNLRAVAARYGVPVEVLATCNNWKPEMKLVAGMKVKLPRQLQISYAGQPVKGDVASLMVGSTSVTAFRFLWEQQGGKLEWDAKNKQVTAINGDKKIQVTIGSRNAQIGDREVMMELAAFLMSGRTMVPVRLFEEGLHAQVEWDPATGRLYVAMAN